MTTKNEQIIVTITGKESVLKDGRKPYWKIKSPQHNFNVFQKKQADAFEEGKTYEIEGGADNEAGYWNLHRIIGEVQAPSAPAHAPSPLPSQRGSNGYKGRDEDAIAQNTVLQTVGQIVAAAVPGRSLDDIVALAKELYGAMVDLRFGLRLGTTSAGHPAPIEGKPVPVVPFIKDGVGGFPKTPLDLVNRALKPPFNYKTKAGFLTALGYEHESEITDVAAAWITLVELATRKE